MQTKNILIGGLVGVLLISNIILHKNLSRTTEQVNSMKYTLDRMEHYFGDTLNDISKSIETVEDTKLWIKNPTYSFSAFNLKEKEFTIDLSFNISSINTDSENYLTWLDLDNDMRVVKRIDLGNLDSLSVVSSTTLPIGHQYRAVFSSKGEDIFREEIIKDIDFSEKFERRFKTDIFFPTTTSDGNSQIQILVVGGSYKGNDKLYGDIEEVKTELIYDENVFYTVDVLNDPLTNISNDEYFYKKSINFIDLGLVSSEDDMKEFMDFHELDKIVFRTTILDSLGVTYQISEDKYGNRAFRIY